MEQLKKPAIYIYIDRSRIPEDSDKMIGAVWEGLHGYRDEADASCMDRQIG